MAATISDDGTVNETAIGKTAAGSMDISTTGRILAICGDVTQTCAVPDFTAHEAL